MKSDTTNDTTTPIPAPGTEASVLVAHWVSVLAHPFVMVFVMVGLGTVRAGGSEDALRNLGLVSLFVVVPVAILTVRQVRRGAWANADASRAHERPLLYSVGIAGTAALVICLTAWLPDPALLRGARVVLGFLVVCAVTTRWIKVSLHVAAASLTATVLLIMGSLVGWVVAGIVPVLMWSRLTLGRHTLPEALLGMVFGIAAGVAMHFP